MIVSHTLVKNGMPFINLVLRQVIPYVDKMLITISIHSNDGTKAVIEALKQEFGGKVQISTEDVNKPEFLTQERQKQLDKCLDGDWILFLDDDDYWPTESLEQIIKDYIRTEHVDALAVSPIQVVNETQQDIDWQKKWFTKWFRKDPGVHYRGPWPKDLIYKGDQMLYWKKNHRVNRIDVKYFHLSYIKGGSFRVEEWAKKYGHQIGELQLIPEVWLNDISKVYDEIRNNR